MKNPKNPRYCKICKLPGHYAKTCGSSKKEGIVYPNYICNLNEFIVCALCNYKARQLSVGHLKVHNITVENYKNLYGETLAPRTKEKFSIRAKLQNKDEAKKESLRLGMAKVRKMEDVQVRRKKAVASKMAGRSWKRATPISDSERIRLLIISKKGRKSAKLSRDKAKSSGEPYGLAKRLANDEEFRVKWSKQRSEISKKTWENPESRKKITEGVKQAWKDGKLKYPTTMTSKLEDKVCAVLTGMGISYKRQRAIKGTRHPFDIRVDKFKLLIEVDGCYWHACQQCKPGSSPKVDDEAVDRFIATQKEWTLFRLKEHDILSGLTENLVNNELERLKYE